MSTFYAIDYSRVSHREWWWSARSPLVLIGWLLKWLRIRTPGSTDDPNVDTTLPFVVAALPEEVAARFQPLAEELTRLGFKDPVYHVISDTGTSTTIYWATFRHESGQHFARIHRRIWQHQAKPADRGTFVLIGTAFTDGMFAISSSGKPDLETPPEIAMQRLRGLAPTALWEAHLLAAAHSGKAVPSISTREELLGAVERHHALLRDFHLARGVFRPRTGAEESQAEAFAATVASAQAAGLEHAEVLAELERLQVHKPGWGNAIVILLVSVAAFLAAGSSNQNWEFTLWLIPVLLLHEAGHWAAMKVFGYRNLRMFFIPLFGAAVMGQNWNVPGWKKALVSLAGPVPGILLGVALAVAGLITGQQWVKTAALLLLLINGFNLLPVLPLDGGHTLHATLFCRNRWLDITFRFVAIAGLLLLSVAQMGKIFMYLAIGMAVGLPLAFKMSKITDALRRVSLPPPLPGEDRIPVAVAQAIIGAVKAAMPAKTNNKTLAQQALNVFETLNARPPGVFGTLGLLSLHGGSFLLAVLCGILLFLDKHGGGLGEFTRAAIRQPQHAIECGSAARWSGTAAAPAGPCHTTVATLPRRDEAQAAFDRLTKQLPATASLLLIGDSLLLKLPAEDDAARERWFNEFHRLSTNTFVALTNRPISLSLSCVASNNLVATNVAQELRDYFQLAGLAEFVAPWSPAALRPEFESARKGRRMWRRISEGLAGFWNNEEFKGFNSKIAAAHRRGAQTEVERLSREQEQVRKALEKQAYVRLRAEGCDGELLDLHAQFSSLPYTNRLERAAVVRQLTARLGGLAPGEDGPRDTGPRYDATGYAVPHGLLLEIRWLGFKDATAGFPALADWLCQQGCSGLKYDILSGASSREELEE